MEPEPLNQGSSLALALEEDADEIGNVAPVWLRGGKTVESSKNSRANKDVRQGDIFTKEFLRKYLFYAKTYKPELTDIAMEVISSAYANMRSKQTQRNLPVTARSLETIIRLSTASAKARLSHYVEEQDADQALALINYVMFHEIGSNPSAEVQSSSSLGGKRLRDPVDSTTDASQGPRGRGYNDSSNENSSFDNDFVAVAPPKSSNKYIRVQEQIRKLFDSSASDMLYINDVLGKLNSLAQSATERYSIPELKAILDDLERDNKIMIDDDMIQSI
jgi:DNA replication licensing factor MCM3